MVSSYYHNVKEESNAETSSLSFEAIRARLFFGQKVIPCKTHFALVVRLLFEHRHQ